MKEKYLIILIVVVVLFATASCISESANLPLDESLKMEVCGSYAVPGMFYPDLKGTESDSEIIDIDSEGRILFEYTAYNVITEKSATYLVICQKHDDNYVYFYEDICYVRSDSSEEIVSELKKENDWNQALNSQKMSRRKICITLDLVIQTDALLSYDRVGDMIASQMKIEKQHILELCFVDQDIEGKEIVFLRCEKEGRTEEYLLLIDKTYSIFYFKIESDIIDVAEFKQFKQNNGWIFGTTGIRGYTP